MLTYTRLHCPQDSHPGWACEHVASDFEKAGVLCQVFRFPPLIVLGKKYR